LTRGSSVVNIGIFSLRHFPHYLGHFALSKTADWQRELSGRNAFFVYAMQGPGAMPF
jgi:hypothetical protein